MMENTAQQSQKKADEALDWIDAEADKWAAEINLPSFIKNLVQVARLNPKVPPDIKEGFIARLEQNIDALVRQTFLEAWIRALDAFKAEQAAKPATTDNMDG